MSITNLGNQGIFDMVQSAYALRTLYVLTKIGVFESLATGEKSLSELIKASGSRKDILEDLLLLAVGLAYLRIKNGRYQLRKKGLLLTRRSESWVRSYLLVWGGQLDPAFAHLEEYALDGKDAFESAHGDSIWDWYRRNPEQNEIFVEFMQGVTRHGHLVHIVDELDIGNARSLVDVAGGTGSLACALAAKYGYLSCIVCDQPSNQERAWHYIKSLGLTNCTFEGVNIFESIPASSDLYTIKHVLHDWDDNNAIRIMAAIAKAMRPDSQLILIEGLLDRTFPASFVNPEYIHTRNMEQRLWTCGRVRKSGDFDVLAARAGLRVMRKWDSNQIADLSYIECTKL